jgi:hypothetical protein
MNAIDRYRASALEADLEKSISDAVKALGGRTFHVRDSRGLDIEDMPDLLVISPPLVALWELKSQRRYVTPGQAEVLELLTYCERLESGVIRPIPREGELSLDSALAILRGEK